MATDGHILCPKCRRVLYLGKHKDGRFWPGTATQEQFTRAVAEFITEHFGHGEVTVLADDLYERWLDFHPENQWPVTVHIAVTHDGRVSLAEQARARRG